MASIEERVVSLKFNNGQFMNGVQDSLNGVKKLEEGLAFRGGVEGINQVSAAAKNLNFSEAQAGIAETKMCIRDRDYIKYMTLNDVDPVVYSHLSMDNVKRIREYIEDSMTATTFVEAEGSSPSRNTITSELVYYWMVALQIPFECQHWHLHRLLTLIRVCNLKNQPDKKMSTAATLRQNQALNAARRAKYKSRG